MAQPHKGDRELTQSRLARPVYDEVKKRAKARGVSISQYIADVMALHVDRPDLVWIDIDQLPLSA
ncbi:toxin-antitoxin system [Nocardia sp. alder85J]|uniref:toxin-antitoxin system n=1 Tax=Nocardia sp. alder85J TaxID=2862949 RepID=UPI001CD5FB3C|nr:toxin-antitoxin system [Nocardia sp. alder85J]MCX4099271.1 toxin-antitoxin system [Nocardia sp. alder85J]